MEYANYNWFNFEEVDISIDLFRRIAIRCGFRILSEERNGVIWYKLKKIGIPCECLYTHLESTHFNFIDLADLHLGNLYCEIDRIKLALKAAVRQHVDYVFIAGDLLDGVCGVHSDECASKLVEQQLDIAYELFRKYPLDIRAIPGNHEFTFDYYGIYNPLKLLEDRLRGETCKFKAYNGYIQDFEIAGVIKRMMHLENYYYRDNTMTIVQRLHIFDEHGGLMVKCEDGAKRPIRFLECGHEHRKLELYDSDFNVFISQPGTFLQDKNFYLPSIHVKGEVLDDLRVVRG